jgi:protein-L-isoaspartate(D-aspartate) O-methyltransferase
MSLAPPARTQQLDPFQAKRNLLVEAEIKGGGITNQQVIESIRNTPRHEFVPRNVRHHAYLDMALPIGDAQTISSPFVVAFMTECLDPRPGDRVLEVGTGSGYQAAVLSPLVKEVYTIEIVAELGMRAKRTLERLKFRNVHVKIGDGYEGWPEHAPFNKIIVTCSPENVPQPLIDQLSDGGIMVIPIGERYQQTLYRYRKEGGQLKSESLRPTLFVPMTGSAEEKRHVKPDPASPTIKNGSFEQAADKQDVVPGWYYARQVELVDSDSSPRGSRHVVFKNRNAGRDSRILQGLAIDGRSVHEIEVSVNVSTEGVVAGPNQELPRLMITFYDDQRRDVGHHWIGPWRGTLEWIRESKRFDVPPRAREAIVRLGLLGATGTARFDGVEIKKTKP